MFIPNRKDSLPRGTAVRLNVSASTDKGVFSPGHEFIVDRPASGSMYDLIDQDGNLLEDVERIEMEVIPESVKEKNRVDFEAFTESEMKQININCHIDYRRYSNGEYREGDLELAWRCWNRRR
jgi:hypothetical protein